jgi:hypothetical protein
MTVQKKRVEQADTGGVKKEKLPSVEELTALATEAYENYNFIEAARLLKKAMVADSNFPPARELFFKLKDDHPNLFDDTPELAGMEDDAPQAPRAIKLSSSRPGAEAAGIKDMTQKETIQVDKRTIGESGLVKTRSSIEEKKVYHIPKTITEAARSDVKKGYREKKSFMASKGGMIALLMGVIALGVIVFMLWQTGWIELG